MLPQTPVSTTYSHKHAAHMDVDLSLNIERRTNDETSAENTWKEPEAFMLGASIYDIRTGGGGCEKIPQFCRQTVHKIQTGGNPNILRTSYVEAP